MLSSSISKQSNTKSYYSSGQIKSALSSCSVRVGGEIDTHYLIYCPFHYNVNTPACEIDKSSGLFICFSCGETGGLMDMVMRTTNRNFFEATRLIKSAEKEVDVLDIVSNSLDTNPDPLQPFDMQLIDRLHKGLMSSQTGIEYFESRSINKESMDFFKLGYSEKQRMVIVPVHDNHGMCVGFVGRSIEGKSFKNSVNLPKRHVLFNLHNVKFSDITVVESSFDTIRLHQVGIPAVATLGASINKNQLQLLGKYASSVFVCPDKDDAGKKMVESIKNGITNKTLTVIDVGDAKDVGDLSDDQIKNIWKNSRRDNLITI